VIEITTLFGALFAVLCGVLAIAHSMRVRRVTLLDWALLAMGGMYGIGWILVLHATKAGENPSWARWILPFQDQYIVLNIGAMLLLFGVLTGWYLAGSIWRLPITLSIKPAATNGTRWARAFWFLLFLAVVAQAAYTYAYGGFLGYLEYSNSIRSGLFDAVPPNPLSFLKPFGALAMVSAFGFFGLHLSRDRRLSVYMGLMLSFFFSLYVLYGWLGRLGFLVFIATFPLALAMYGSRSPLRLITSGGVSFVGLLVGAYALSVWLDLKSADNLMAFLARELSFPFGSFFAQLDHEEHLFLGFVHFLWSPVYLLPSSLWTNWLEPVSQINTAVIMGAPKGEAGVTAGIPVDLLTLGLMQVHLPGIVLTGVLFGGLLSVLQALLCRIPDCGIGVTFEANLALSLAVLGVFYSQPDLVLSGHIHWIAAALIMMALHRLPSFSIRINRKCAAKIIAS
jgi:hypothetical protein